MAENDWLIGLTVGLDDSKSKEQIKKDIEKLRKTLDSIEFQVKLSADQKKEIKSQLDTLEIGLDNVSISENALKGLVAQINNALSKIEIKNINITSGNTTNQAEVIGHNIGNNIVSGISQEINKGSNILENFTKTLSNIGMEPTLVANVAKEIQALDIQIETLKQTTNDKNGLSVKIGGLDNLKNAVEYTARFNVETGELLDLIKSVSTVQQRAGATAEVFIEKQQKAVAAAENTLSTIKSKLNDSNSPKSLAGTDFNTNGLAEQLERVELAISILGNSSKDTFTQAQIEVDKEITALNNLISTLKNAEYAATSLRTKGLSTTKEIYSSKLDVLITKMKSSGTYTAGFQNGANNLKELLNNAVDTSGLTAFLNGLDKLEAGYKRAEASAKAFTQTQKIGIEVSGLQSHIANLQKISPEIDNFETEIQGTKVTVQSLNNELSKVSTSGDLSVVQKKMKAFEKAAQAAGIAVTEINFKSTQSQIDDIQKKLNKVH